MTEEEPMKTCSLFDFMAEMKPWLDREYIRRAYIDTKDNFVLQFLDGTRNVYAINDCSAQQIRQILKDLRHRGIDTAGMPADSGEEFSDRLSK